jgi:hypothetical protein
MSYIVEAPLVLAKDKEGKVHERYEGAVIDWLSPEQAAHLVSTGLVREVGGPAADEPPAEGGKPAEDATKADLIAWLVENAVDEDGGDYTESKLQPHNKAQLWDLINAVED